MYYFLAVAIVITNFLCASFANAETNECLDFRSSLPKDYIQGYVRVPEDWSNPNGKTIRVFYYGRLSKDRAPILFFNGGPASDSHSSAVQLHSNKYSKDLPIIYMDQRGTGCSDQYPKEVTPENLERMQKYGLSSIVKDAEAIRAKLLGEYGRWQILGQSYGAYAVHRYVELAPEQLISAHAHGFAYTADPVEFRVQRLLAQKRSFDEFLKKYPKDAEIFQQLRAAVDALPPTQKCFSTGTMTICGSAVLDRLNTMLAFPSKWRSLSLQIHDLMPMRNLYSRTKEPGRELDKAELKDFVQRFVFEGGLGKQRFAFLTLIKMETSSPLSLRELCEKAMAELVRRGESPDTWYVNECRSVLAMQDPVVIPMVESRSFADIGNIDNLAESLRTHPRLKFYLYGGALDSIVPPVLYKEETERLGDLINFTLFPNSGHDGFMTEAKIWRELKAAHRNCNRDLNG